MVACLHDLRILRVAALTAVLAANVPSRVASQDAQAVKTWPKQGAWQVSLAHEPQNGYLCMLNAFGSDPHAFGVSFMETPGYLAFMLDDRISTKPYQPTMTVSIDGDEIAIFETFNDPPMTSSKQDDAVKVRFLLDRFAVGSTLTVDARGARYRLSLAGFPDTAGQFEACKLAAVKLRGQETTGHND
jgi:hypothetical protein